MENVSYPLIRVYEGLIENKEDINAWTSDACFPTHDLNALQKQQLNDVNVLELIFQGSPDRILSNERFDKFQSLVTEYILNDSLSPYLIRIEHKMSLKNRIRSYKGVISREIESKDYIELELSVVDDYSLIVAIVSLNELNISKSFDYFYDNMNCCIMLTSLDVFSVDFLKELYKKYILIDNTVGLNYIGLSLDFCKGEDCIIRTAGDGGDVEIDLQVFTFKTNTEKVAQSLSSLSPS